MASVETFEDLFEKSLRDIYDAEKQHTKALPKMLKKVHHPELKEAFQKHLEETERQVERLEQMFEILEIKGKGERCEAAQGLVQEAQETMSEVDDPQIRDAGIIAAAQALKHYEIAHYGTLIAWAQKLNEREVVKLLQETLREEHAANQLLNQLAEQTINEEAMEAGDEDTGEEGEEHGEDMHEDDGEAMRAGGMEEDEDEVDEERGRQRRGQGGERRQPPSPREPRQAASRGQQKGSRQQGRNGNGGRQQGGRNGNGGSKQAKGGGADDLKQREYKDAQGRTRYHTRAYMRQHAKG